MFENFNNKHFNDEFPKYFQNLQELFNKVKFPGYSESIRGNHLKYFKYKLSNYLSVKKFTDSDKSSDLLKVLKDFHSNQKEISENRKKIPGYLKDIIRYAEVIIKKLEEDEKLETEYYNKIFANRFPGYFKNLQGILASNVDKHLANMQRQDPKFLFDTMEIFKKDVYLHLLNTNTQDSQKIEDLYNEIIQFQCYDKSSKKNKNSTSLEFISKDYESQTQYKKRKVNELSEGKLKFFEGGVLDLYTNKKRRVASSTHVNNITVETLGKTKDNQLS
ncbi:MAG: hypothetical protein HRK26_04700 [Rickettsiaceae bacterium H1]|nr:hypothetical protein [Rickettsiaceae bacterium H1]